VEGIDFLRTAPDAKAPRRVKMLLLETSNRLRYNLFSVERDVKREFDQIKTFNTRDVLNVPLL